MKRLLLKLAVAAGLVSTLAACNHDNNNTATTIGTPTPPTTPTGPKFAALGAGFANDLAANPNSEPAAVSASDVVAVNNTSEPLSVT